MKGWLFLVIAIVGEVIATSALKSSEGFTKLAPSAVVIIGYGIAFYFLSLVLKSIPVGVAYAVWSGLGVVIITAIAWLLHGQKLDAWGFVCLLYPSDAADALTCVVFGGIPLNNKKTQQHHIHADLHSA
ncbi:quaternary ammonium compound efflux SMR transporter QacE, partial [Citrobacter amalonaticus]|uniref:quaternary ammonium compound efflux SMR transporter QacE n=1 Tax=Citrobacter amalonaticus TaxID=35703 RepID=UPI0039A61057